MRFTLLAAAAAAALSAAPALAQDTDTSGDAPPGVPAAPDGSRAFGFVPYFGVMGGWEQFDNERNRAGIPRSRNSDGTVRYNDRLDGSEITGVVGFNVPLGPVFVGAEGNVAKGISGDIDWEYGAAGRFGVRAGDSGLFYGKVGYQWVNFDRFGKNSPDYNDITYGIGTEFGPKDIGLGGITNNAGFRIRAEMSTFGNAHSLRPSLGVITHF